MTGDVVEAPIEISKELEIVNFRALLSKNSRPKQKKDDIITVINKGNVKRWALKNNKVSPDKNKPKKNDKPKTQLAAFQGAMKLLFILGQLIGLNPVRGILERDVEKIRFTICYWRFLHCLIVGITQTISSVLCLYILKGKPLTIEALGYFAFCTSTCMTTFLFIRIGTKWSKLMNDVSKCNLAEYIDTRVKTKCYIVCVITIALATIEHFLSVNVKITHTIECHSGIDMYEKYLKDQFPWFFYLDVPVSIPIGIILQVLNVTSTLTWSYADLYIVCMSIYLVSILDQINIKIIAASQKHYLPSSFWRSLREDYNRATQLVRSFDDAFSGIVFTCFANNLFFICLQLFNILMHGVKFTPNEGCRNVANGPFKGYEYTLYLLFSTTYLFIKSLTVSLMAASVNTASLVPAPALYSVPASAYKDEVSRFITQVNGDNIALSGLQFFYVTRDLILSMAGIIVTYELVLLQFSGNDKSADK